MAKKSFDYLFHVDDTFNFNWLQNHLDRLPWEKIAAFCENLDITIDKKFAETGSLLHSVEKFILSSAGQDEDEEETMTKKRKRKIVEDYRFSKKLFLTPVNGISSPNRLHGPKSVISLSESNPSMVIKPDPDNIMTMASVVQGRKESCPTFAVLLEKLEIRAPSLNRSQLAKLCDHLKLPTDYKDSRKVLFSRIKRFFQTSTNGAVVDEKFVLDVINTDGFTGKQVKNVGRIKKLVSGVGLENQVEVVVKASVGKQKREKRLPQVARKWKLTKKQNLTGSSVQKLRTKLVRTVPKPKPRGNFKSKPKASFKPKPKRLSGNSLKERVDNDDNGNVIESEEEESMEAFFQQPVVKIEKYEDFEEDEEILAVNVPQQSMTLSREVPQESTEVNPNCSATQSCPQVEAEQLNVSEQQLVDETNLPVDDSTTMENCFQSSPPVQGEEFFPIIATVRTVCSSSIPDQLEETLPVLGASVRNFNNDPTLWRIPNRETDLDSTIAYDISSSEQINNELGNSLVYFDPQKGTLAICNEKDEEVYKIFEKRLSRNKEGNEGKSAAECISQTVRSTNFKMRSILPKIYEDVINCLCKNYVAYVNSSGITR